MATRSPFRLSVLLTLGAGASALAQEPVRVVELPPGVVVQGADPAAAAAAAAGWAQGENAPPSPRLQALQKPKYDRRPSTILKAWAAPEIQPLTDEELQAVEEPSPTEASGDQATDRPSPDAPPVMQADEPAAGAQPTTTSGQPAASPARPAAATAAGGRSGAQPAAGTAGPPAAEAADNPAETDAGTADAEAAAKAAAEAAAAKAKAEAEAKKNALEARKLKRELEIFQRDVTLGRWQRVGDALQELAEGERAKGYEALLRGLAAPPPKPQQTQVPPDMLEQNAYDFADVLALARIAPGGLQKKQVEMLAPLLKRAVDAGHVLDEFLVAARSEVAKPDAERALDERLCALLLGAIGQDLELGAFLPAPEAAEEADDREALNLLARLSLALYDKEKKTVHLVRAWKVTQAALAKGEIEAEEKAEALRRAVDLAPKISEELGLAWLEESFTDRPDRGMEILATIGSQAALGFQENARNPDFRKKGLELQKTAVEALLRTAPERAKAWRDSLDLLADNWIREALHAYRYSAATSMRPYLQRDYYGNYFYTYPGGGRVNHVVQAIEPAELLDARPDGVWVELLDDSLKPYYSRTVAQLYLKVNEEEAAFPFIEALAETHAEQARELAEEFVRVWTRNHNPNSSNNTDPYMFMYGFNRRASGIPLTRSKQERNLSELKKWAAKLRALPIEPIDDDLLVNAFTTCHSTAEVYRLETFEEVFGSFENLGPRSLATMLQEMRANLVSVWRRPDVQEQAKTRRRQKDIEREVLAGYVAANMLVDTALREHEDDWSLLCAKAALTHDENNFRQEVAKSSDFAARRLAALEDLARAAELYVGVAPELTVDDETTDAFESWFYASLGACDLGAIDERTVLAKDQPALIRRTLESLPGESRERHVTKFANLLFTRLSAVNPAVKSRYLTAGFEIVGDHPAAHEARKVFDYYRDLVSEIRLEARIDGRDVVGTEQPFGVHVDIVHTREIERESGGFEKYLQNQNNMAYAFNYGRPLENYRDKFQDAATAALQEQFEILSVTFNGENVHSVATERYGWRRTPYAYLLLKARGPEVDKIPPLQLDMDFLDTSGHVVLPIGSPAVPMAARTEPEEPRPFAEVEVTQILDERRVEEGRLVLEVKASARGLVPDLEELVQLAPEQFDVVDVADQGVSVTSFAEDQDGVLSERIWNVSLRVVEDLGRPAETFQFAKPVDEGMKVVYQRYADADLIAAEAEVQLEEDFGESGFPWLWVLLPAGLLVGGVLVVLLRRRLRRRQPALEGLAIPDRITPFTVLGLLREIERNNHLGDEGRRELSLSIETIERYYFAGPGGQEPDLRGIAETWVQRAG